jgi:hypothetical protein
LCIRGAGLGREGGRESDVRCWLGGWLGGWGNIVGAGGEVHCDSACWAGIGDAAATTARKASDVEGEGVLKACCICILDDREAVGREAFEAGRDIPSIGSHRVINSSYASVS